MSVKNYSDLTYRGQVQRLRRLVETALGEYGLAGSTLKFIQHAENATFDVRSNGRAGGRFLARVHRPEYHTVPEIRSEMMWLKALSADTGLHVPRPRPNIHGDTVTVIDDAGVPGPRPMVLLEWMPGRIREEGHRPVQLRRLGRLMAQLHEHASTWNPPAGFCRGEWRWDGLFGKDFGVGLSEQELWDTVPDKGRKVMREAAEIARATMRKLGTGHDVYGLIHADLHLGNLVFAGNSIKPIDFDDCGYGYWLYDLAVIIDDLHGRPESTALLQALLDGYEEVRRLSRDQLDYLDDFVAARRVSLALWVFSMARTNPGMADWVDGALERSVPRMEEFLRNRRKGESRILANVLLGQDGD